MRRKERKMRCELILCVKKQQKMFLNSEDDSELLNEIGFDIPTLRAPKMVMDKVECGFNFF